jgi:hypothetical protein
MPPYGAFTSPAGNAMPAKLDDKQTAGGSFLAFTGLFMSFYRYFLSV